MRQMSEEHYAAGWIIGLEHYLWHMATTKPNTEEGQILLFLAECGGGWWAWDDTYGAPVFVPLPLWTQAYDDSAIAEPV